MGKAIKINENDTEYTVVLKKVTYSQYNSILDSITDIDVIGSVTKSKIKVWETRRKLLEMSVESITPAGLKISDLSIPNGQLLESGAMKYNGLEPGIDGSFPLSE
jgi:hypothetical protein